MRVQGVGQGALGLCAHVHMKGDRVPWKWLVLAWDRQWCIALPSSVTPKLVMLRIATPGKL